MKRLLALLLLSMVPAVYGQAPDWTDATNVQNIIINSGFQNCQPGATSCSAWQEGDGFQPADWNGGAYTFSYTDGTLFQTIDLTEYNTNAFNFTFQFDLNNSCRNSIGGSCNNVDGPIDRIFVKLSFYDQSGLNNEFTFLNGPVSTADIACGSFDFFGLCLGGYEANSNWQTFGWYSHVTSDNVFTSARLEFGGKDVGYWGGLYGPSIDNATLSINYLDAPIAPDCTINPTDITCIINDLTDFTDQDQTFFADTGFDNGSDDGSDVFDDTSTESDFQEDYYTEEMLAEADLLEDDLEEDFSDETPLEELLADELDDEEDIVGEERILVYRELSDEEKSKILEDSITKSTLEAALSVATDAVSAASTASNESASTSSISSSSSKESSNQQETMTAEATSMSNNMLNEEIAVISNGGDLSAELLETGRVMGQEALAATLAGSEASANESMGEAETITAMAAGASMNVDTSSGMDVTQIEETTADDGQEQNMGIMVADSTEQSIIESAVAEAAAQAESSAEMVFDVGKEMMAENAEQMAAIEAQESEALAIVAAAAASSEQTFEDESAKDAEVTNAMVDPAFAMANTFNQAPNMMSLEFLGVLKPIEKSDAEIRAEQVVAANKEQQDAINANYMDADQSGIVAAIGSEADVSSYLSQRLADVPFYRPEDIYKGVIIKDNVRGSYFLEKGNTDTYKKMVEEQYEK